jgi:hypothetical protein
MPYIHLLDTFLCSVSFGTLCNALCLSNKASIYIITQPCFKIVCSSIRRYRFLVIFTVCYRTKFHKTYSKILSIIAMKMEVKYTGFDVLVTMLMKSDVFGTWRRVIPFKRVDAELSDNVPASTCRERD